MTDRRAFSLADILEPRPNLATFLCSTCDRRRQTPRAARLSVLTATASRLASIHVRRQIGLAVDNLFVGLQITGFLCVELVLQPIQAQ